MNKFYRNHKEFCDRPTEESDCNGFSDLDTMSICNLTNCTGCWQCTSCTDCKDCTLCEKCVSCVDCYYCHKCTISKTCLNCDNCIGCLNCESCLNLEKHTNSVDKKDDYSNVKIFEFNYLHDQYEALKSGKKTIDILPGDESVTYKTGDIVTFIERFFEGEPNYIKLKTGEILFETRQTEHSVKVEITGVDKMAWDDICDSDFLKLGVINEVKKFNRCFVPGVVDEDYKLVPFKTIKDAAYRIYSNNCKKRGVEVHFNKVTIIRFKRIHNK